MKLIDSPVAIRTAKTEDVVKIAKYYDKYEFTGGTELCDHVLAEYFKDVSAGIDIRTIPAPDVDFIVDSVVVAKDANLEKALEAGMASIWQLLRTRKVPVGRTAFTGEHMKKLAPLMDETADDARSLDLVQGLAGGPYDLSSGGFPEKFVGDCSEYFAHQILIKFISSILLSGSNCGDIFSSGPNGHFKQDGDDYSFSLQSEYGTERETVEFDGVEQYVFIRRRSKEEGWAIIFQTEPAADEEVVETVAYKVPLSGNLTLPPSTGWVSEHHLARGGLCLTYYLNDKGVNV